MLWADEDPESGSAAQPGELRSAAQLAVRLSYAVAIVRFVNGFADAAQRGVGARSVEGLAKEMGLPVHLVDLRHAATHGALPALQILRFSARTALEWLREHYWRREADAAAARAAEGAAFLRSFAEAQVQAHRLARQIAGRNRRLEARVKKSGQESKRLNAEHQARLRVSLLQLEQSRQQWVDESMAELAALDDMYPPEQSAPLAALLLGHVRRVQQQQQQQNGGGDRNGDSNGDSSRALHQDYARSSGLGGDGHGIPCHLMAHACNPCQGEELSRMTKLWKPALKFFAQKRPTFVAILLTELLDNVLAATGEDDEAGADTGGAHEYPWLSHWYRFVVEQHKKSIGEGSDEGSGRRWDAAPPRYIPFLPHLAPPSFFSIVPHQAIAWASRLATWLGNIVSSPENIKSANQVVAAAQAANSLLPLLEGSVDAAVFARLRTVVVSAQKDARVLAAAARSSAKSGADGVPASKRARRTSQPQAVARPAAPAWAKAPDRRWALTPIGCLPGGRWPRLEVEPALAEAMKASERPGAEAAKEAEEDEAAEEAGEEDEAGKAGLDGGNGGGGSNSSSSEHAGMQAEPEAAATAAAPRPSLSHRSLAGGINFF